MDLAQSSDVAATMVSDPNWLAAFASIAGAIVAAAAAFLTIWWPWHTRKAPAWSLERTYRPVSELTREQLGALILTCGQIRPILFVELINSGDGPARNLQIEGQDCDAVFFQLDTTEQTGFRRSERMPVLDAAKSVSIVITPRSAEPVAMPHMLLRWQSEPTRLRRSHTSTPFDVPYRLPAKRPLKPVEKSLVVAALQSQAAYVGLDLHTYMRDVLPDLDLNWVEKEGWLDHLQ